MPDILSEKTPLSLRLPTSNRPSPSEPSRCRGIRIWIFFASAISLWWFVALFSEYDDASYGNAKLPVKPLTCPQVVPLLPTIQTPKLLDMDAMFSSDSFRNLSINRLAGAVKIPTMSYDDLGVIGEDKRWDTMYDLAGYLERTFPLTYEKLEVEKVNTHGLLFTWKGSDTSLKPVVLMAHQDVVPVDETTVDAWVHPPFSGFYDGKYIWGRGSSDCKSQLLGILGSVESLLGADFEPRRTVLLSFGFDEEASGTQGAGHLASFILDRYGPDSLAVIVDEGANVEPGWGALFAPPAVGEKGYIDITVTVRTPGGHSSIPPPHTSIGILSELITHIEADTYPTWLDDDNPYLHMLECGGAWAPDFPKKIKKLLPKVKSYKAKPDYLALEAAKAGPAVRYLMQTSVAVDIISAGVKINALPERASAIVNHRINIGERSTDVRDKIAHLSKKIASKYNLTLHAYDDIDAPSSILLSAANTTLEPAPVTPTSIETLSPYTILSGTIRALYGNGVIVAPGLSTGNTDTRYYWDLTKHIFRYGPGWEEGEYGLGGIHTINERVSVKAHIAGIKWFSLFIRNMDESALA